jgi:hypothetical protein
VDPETVKALQRTAGNRAVTRMLARTPEETVDLLEQGLGATSPDGDHINRTLSAYSFDREGWGKVGEAFKKKTEKELPPTMQSRLAPDDMAEAQKRLPR